ncbi:MAG TPA: CoA transferase, partial [Ilumatobacteraceae bacterium]|nr:CoA transferase [Ilumatobacteraceae bacterium]
MAFVEPSEGHELRWRGSADGTSPLFAYLHAGKRSILEPDSFDELLAGTDVVVTDRLSEAWDALHARHPHLSVVVITPFGMHGPWADRPATDLTLQAASGGMAP